MQKTSPCKSALVEILSATINISSVFNTANGHGPPKHMMNLIFSLLEKYRNEQDIICNAIACLTNMTRTNATGRFWTRERVKQLLNVHAWHLLNPHVSCKIAGLMHNMTMDSNCLKNFLKANRHEFKISKIYELKKDDFLFASYKKHINERVYL